ncbi:MAG TPA: DnaA N-terminal domain-containing protein [Thermomicrobiaceae bacterium]|nr:DnaA N-terminal domain-containing protein [Thermomicrobiaceae bacterium]
MPREGPGQQPDKEQTNGDAASGAADTPAEAAASRGGEDARRRGWFWHWNTIITQYAPLIGLKGVGLLNSYTVWTDRREESPLRGYAFPSQQSEADFYGEDRAELITINKILVTLDLIEIRKQMVQRVDERGRRWRVPHNLYRVKDHPEGYRLGPDDVRRVVALAERDRAVYRYIRRIFSTRFAPIDADNVWHEILASLRDDPVWRRLAERTQAEEARASARTRAGHARRAQEGDGATDRQTQQKGDSDGGARAPEGATSVGGSNDAGGIGVAPGNTGSPPVAGAGNTGSTPISASSDGGSNSDGENSVGQTNTTYHQTPTTTTTTTGQSPAEAAAPADAPGGAGPLPEPAAAVVACFSAANGRPATPLERELLAELAQAFAANAGRAGTDGPGWVIAAIREAVGSGSRFVAPKRIREILARWAQAQAHGDQLRPGGAAAPPTAPDVATPAATPPAADVALPNGQPADAAWAAALQLLAGALERAEHERLFGGSRILGYQAGTVRVRVASAASAERLSGEYYDLVARKLSQVLRRPVRLTFQTDEQGEPAAEPFPVVDEATPAAPAPERMAEPPALPSFTLPGGLTNRQLWAAAQDELARRLSAASWESWIRPAVLLARTDEGTLVVGVPTAFAQRRVAERLRGELEAVLGDLLGQPAAVEVVVTHDWLRTRARWKDAG